jgi:hypothetical protein
MIASKLLILINNALSDIRRTFRIINKTFVLLRSMTESHCPRLVGGFEAWPFSPPRWGSPWPRTFYCETLDCWTWQGRTWPFHYPALCCFAWRDGGAWPFDRSKLLLQGRLEGGTWTWTFHCQRCDSCVASSFEEQGWTCRAGKIFNNWLKLSKVGEILGKRRLGLQI